MKSLALDFAMSASGEDFSRLDVMWHTPPNWWGNDEQPLSVDIRKCYAINGVYNINLITFPTSIPIDFDLHSLQFPYTINGIILNVDLSRFGWDSDTRSDKSRADLKSLERGGILWIKDEKLPSVIIATSFNPPLISRNEMRNLLGLSQKTPVLPYLKNTRDESRFQFFLTYEHEYIQNVLTALVNQISVNNA